MKKYKVSDILKEGNKKYKIKKILHQSEYQLVVNTEDGHTIQIFWNGENK
jgi:hypothetical protein